MTIIFKFFKSPRRKLVIEVEKKLISLETLLHTISEEEEELFSLRIMSELPEHNLRKRSLIFHRVQALSNEIIASISKLLIVETEFKEALRDEIKKSVYQPSTMEKCEEVLRKLFLKLHRLNDILIKQNEDLGAEAKNSKGKKSPIMPSFQLAGKDEQGELYKDLQDTFEKILLRIVILKSLEVEHERLMETWALIKNGHKDVKCSAEFRACRLVNHNNEREIEKLLIRASNNLNDASTMGEFLVYPAKLGGYNAVYYVDRKIVHFCDIFHHSDNWTIALAMQRGDKLRRNYHDFNQLRLPLVEL